MKYRNIRTGVIVEPVLEEVLKTFAEHPDYEPVEEKGKENAKLSDGTRSKRKS